MKKQTNKQSKSYLAKLLATENITVEHRKVPTAFFDLQNRLLVVPIWKKEMSNDVLDLLLAHEIGHALYTPQKEWKEAIDNDRIPHSFLNVVEDARIEKLVKRKYAGLQQTFIKGYRDLIQQDFFKTKDRDINDMLLVDRLNMHFKSSHIESDIDFTSAELDIVDRMKKLETFEDVKKLAAELAGYCTKEKEEKQIEQEELQSSGNLQIDDTEDSEGDSHAQGKENEEEENDNEENATTSSADTDEEKQEEQKVEEEPTDNASESSGHQNNDNQSESIDNQELVSETDNAWSKQSHSLLDKECKENEYFSPHEFKNLKEIVIDYKKVLKDFAKCFEHKENHYLYENQRAAILEFKNEFKKFMSTQNKSVNYMVKEFEMKKSAAAYARTSQDKTGIINPLKLHSYKFNDDIFKRIAVTPDGKNHGMMMFIDWSGSMSDKLKNTLHQLMILTMFCQKVKIPFEVYAFSNNGVEYRDGTVKIFKPVYQLNDITIDQKFHLINLASSKMRAKEFHSALMNMFHVACKHDNRLWYSYRRRLNNMNDYEDTTWIRDLPEIPRGYGLSSTPLNDCIMAAYKLVPAFVEKYSIDKMNTIFLTDGCSDGNNGKIVSYDDNTDPYKDRIGDNFTYDSMMCYDKNSVLVDRKTKKHYDCEYSWRNKNGLTENLLQCLKDRTGSKVLGFYVSARKRIDNYAMDKYFSYRDRSKVHAEMRKNKVVTVTDSTGYDEIYLLVGDNMQVEDGQMATPSENAKKGEIKRLFTSTLKGNRQSRILLNKFISQVA